MGLMRAIVSVAADSVLARDRCVNTLYFDVTNVSLLVGTDADALASDLATIYHNLMNPTATREIDVRLYNMDDPKPRPIAGRFTKNVGAAPAGNIPREVAVCLSFYADRNLPKRRGRIFLPAFAIGDPFGLRPAATTRTKLLDLADSFSGLGGVNVDWCMHSVKDQAHHKISTAWVDDEWDVQRSRGLRATTRATRNVSG